MYSTVQSFFFLSVAGENIIAYLFVDVISFFFLLRRESSFNNKAYVSIALC